MATRHVTTKLKPQLSHHIASWNNYKKLFELITSPKTEEFYITTQWIYDITQEFAYQFQGFCQYRSSLSTNNQDSLKLLQANRDAWTLPEVMSLLQKIIRAGQLDKLTGPLALNQATVLQQFAYFATIELARLECLIGDHTSSLQVINRLKIGDRNELYTALPICHFNVYYHLGVCNMLLKRYDEALDVFSEIILYVLRLLKPGASATLRPGVPAQLQRMVDKALSLAAILLVMHPNYPVDDPVREAVEAKFDEKMRRLRNGDRSIAADLFESACPKFISPVVPDYNNLGHGVQMGQTVFDHQSSVFIAEVMQHVAFYPLRSFLSMYASVDIDKLARFMETSETDLISLLLAYKSKIAEAKMYNKPNTRGRELQFVIEGGILIVEKAPVKTNDLATEKYFIAGVKKHDEILSRLQKTFSTLGL